MNIVVYSKPNCNWCVKAKELLNKLHIQYDELVLDVDYDRDELRQLVPENIPLTVPQVFHDDHRVGGYEELVEYLDNRGMLNDE
jgi:glutaredoxin